MDKNLNISIIAPRGTGKTTLIGALYHFATTEIQNGNGYRLEVPSQYKSQLKRIDQAREQFARTLCPIFGTNEVEKFSFRYVIDRSTYNITFMDIPGGFTDYFQFGSSNDDYKCFEEHLKTSPILFIPIDTPCLMEEKTFGQSASSLDIFNIGEAIKYWAQYRNKSNDKAVLHFVMSKFELYNHECSQKQCFERFKTLYKDLIFNVWSECPQRLEINYTPVEVFGNIHLDRVNSCWSNDGQYAERFVKIGNFPTTINIDTLWYTINDYIVNMF